MEQINKRNTIPFLATTALLLLLTLNKLHSYYSTGGDYNNGLYCLLLLAVIFITGWNYTKSLYDKIALAFFFLCLPSLFIHSNGFIAFLVDFSTMLALPAGLVMGKSLLHWHMQAKRQDFFITILLIPFFYSIIYCLINKSIAFEEIRDVIFIMCCYIPFLLLYKSRLKYILLPIITFLIIQSTKRSGIIYTGIILLSFMIGSVTKSRHKLFSFLMILIVLLIFGYIFVSIFGLDFAITENAFERFENMDDDGGSNRSGHYAAILASFYNSDLLSQLFGHGYMSVNNSFAMPAHNDFLEILYDFGAIPVILYITFWISIIVFAIKQIKNKNVKTEHSIYLLGLVLGFLSLALLNCMVTNGIYYILLVSSISYYVELTKNSNIYE